MREDFVVAGGLANIGRIIELMERELGIQLHLFGPGVDFAGALGAALSGDNGCPHRGGLRAQRLVEAK
jgi:activator of 2-hydroxyglutaryl-CoA dehydratase